MKCSFGKFVSFTYANKTCAALMNGSFFLSYVLQSNKSVIMNKLFKIIDCYVS